jgi:DEAD/DEAH box helicase domain-containing protein
MVRLAVMIEDLIKDLSADETFLRSVTHWKTIPAREAQYRDLPAGLDARLTTALAEQGITALYSHQAEAIEHILDGADVVVVTPTASGKTLTYNLPVLSAMTADPDVRALYLFPTKALSQDQQAVLNETVERARIDLTAVTYDGDTPPAVRTKARNAGRIIISNPDMLHAGILPNHTKWSHFFQNLRYIVIDELHTYRGIFGSHVANVIRRLRRVAAFYGSNPQFVLSSATIGNPSELAEAIIGRPVRLVDANGAPQGEKHLILYNPPLVDRVQGIRRGVVKSSHAAAVQFLRAGVKTIVFSRSRLRTELIAGYIRESVANVFTENERIRVESYRGGYLPSERRAIERGLRDGTIHGVVSTNALELGIDIGGLDAAILAGFPGTVASTLQQAGRSGRRASVSLALLVANASPVDQFVVEHPEYFLARNPESAYINPDNPYVLFDHLKCAVFEIPMRTDERFADPAPEMLQILEENGVIRFSGDAYHWADRSYPAEQISLRSATSDNVIIVDRTGGNDEVIGEMARPSAKALLFENAIYIHRDTQYVVRSLDIENRRCEVEQSTVNYFTDSLLKIDIKVLTEDERAPYDTTGVESVVGDVLVRSIAAKFKKLKFETHENIGYGEIDLPEEQMHTRALMLVVRSGEIRELFDSLPPGARPVALSRTARIIRNVAPVFLMSGARDLRVHANTRDPHFVEPTIYFYDAYPGGSGLAEALRSELARVIGAARERVTSCGCRNGCPSCVGPIDASEGWDGDPKALVVSFLEALAR